jgi:hypothetical protein
MKRIYLFFLLLSLSAITLSADITDWRWQEVEYHFDGSAPKCSLTVLMNYWIGDTVMHGGLTYHTVYQQCVYQDSTELRPNGLYGAEAFSWYELREDSSGCLYCLSDFEPEQLLYDFSDWEMGDTLFSGGMYVVISETSLDSIRLLDGTYVQTATYPHGLVIIKGIGLTDGFFFTVAPHATIMGGMIVSFEKGGKLIWRNPDYVGLPAASTVKFVRVWVQESSLMMDVPASTQRVEVYGMNGALEQSYRPQGKTVIQTKPLHPGLYVCRFVDGAGRVMAREKVMVP